MMDDRLELEASRCWIRHIRRGVSTDLGAVQVIPGAWFAPNPLEGVNGNQGWLSAQPERRMSDDGSLTVTFPNADGEDGRPHVERFALLTDPAYRPGEEWLELYREPGGPGDLMFVGTPVEWDLSPTELNLVLADALVLLANTRATEVDFWNGAAPREVFEHYTQIKTFGGGADVRGVTGGLPAGWFTEAQTTGPIVQFDRGIRITPNASEYARLGVPTPLVNPDGDWEAELRARMDPGAALGLTVGHPDDLTVPTAISGGVSVIVSPNSAPPPPARGFIWGDVEVGSYSFSSSPPVVLDPTGAITLRLVARGDFVHAFVNGQFLQVRRRVPSTGGGIVSVTALIAGSATVEAMHVMDLKPLLARGADRGEHRLPGDPSSAAVGLHAERFSEADAAVAAGGDDNAFHAFALLPGLEPTNVLLDAGVDHAVSSDWGGFWGNVTYPFSARWTGSIYLDLATADEALELTIIGGRARLWVAGLKLIDHTNEIGGTSAIGATGGLIAELGAVSGWYPIRLEFSHYNGGFPGSPAFRLGRVIGGVHTYVPADHLSPLGTFDQAVRYDSHRELLSQITEAFGYQWRLEPRSLESGSFPGELVPRIRVGVDTDYVIDDLEGQQAQSSGTAADAIDGLLLDAAGLAATDPDAPGITAEILLLELAAGHLAVHQAYESLAEISERGMLEVRGNSLLATRAAPAENIAASPTGTRGLARLLAPGIVPLQLTGQVARMRWEPGDGVRLALDGLRAHDLTPRQITTVAWPCRPDGVGPPTVGFRQRPRGIRAVLARALRVALGTARALGR